MVRTTDPDVLCQQILTLMSRGYSWEIARGLLRDCPKNSTGIIRIIREIAGVNMSPKALHTFAPDWTTLLDSDWDQLLHEASIAKDFDEARVSQWILFLKDCYQLSHSRWPLDVEVNLERSDGPLAEYHDILVDMFYREPPSGALFQENEGLARLGAELDGNVWGAATSAYLSSSWDIDLRVLKKIRAAHSGPMNLGKRIFLYSKVVPIPLRVARAVEIGERCFREIHDAT